MTFRHSYSWNIALLGLLIGSSSFGASTPAVQLKIMSLNVWQFAYGIESTNNIERADKLAQVINQKNDEFDVIGFEEMWSNTTRDHVYEQIQNNYPYRFEDNQWGALFGLGFTSGLALYSKYPIVRHMQYTYQNYRGDEDMAKKGLMGIQIEIHGKPAYIFVTHLQAGAGGAFFQFLDRDKPSTVEMSALQLLEAKEQIHSFVGEKNAPIFLMGDLNISFGSQEYQNDMMVLGNAVDTFDSSKSKYLGSDMNVLPDTNRIDYILTLGSPVPGYSTIIDDFGKVKEVSDHRAVSGTFDISEF